MRRRYPIRLLIVEFRENQEVMDNYCFNITKKIVKIEVYILRLNWRQKFNQIVHIVKRCVSEGTRIDLIDLDIW